MAANRVIWEPFGRVLAWSVTQPSHQASSVRRGRNKKSEKLQHHEPKKITVNVYTGEKIHERRVPARRNPHIERQISQISNLSSNGERRKESQAGNKR